ncbi:hypothetical protein [Hymenobacter volaticus]|uniref:Uncharacterized protein n=1 Tax=Hymenobacter volaticus TaxID=2932254 RepID=A0ABY4GD45_9BACT|nr:hypothetical protein [Hymenobacter volaticus]UOQ68817.1 hypothetical protein MUN86_25430 [Hymenobacter volaticus]
MTTLHCSIALLLSVPLASVAQPAPSDSAPAPRHLFTLHTLRIKSPFIPALGYEVPVWSRWGCALAWVPPTTVIGIAPTTMTPWEF